MTKTENYQLPQWAANDPVRREDFNGAFAALDGAYSPQNRQVEYVRCSASGKEAGSVIYTFAKAPVCVILFGRYAPTIIPQGSMGGLMDYYTYDSNYHANFKLIGTQLTLYNKGASFSGTSLYVIAVC